VRDIVARLLRSRHIITGPIIEKYNVILKTGSTFVTPEENRTTATCNRRRKFVNFGLVHPELSVVTDVQKDTLIAVPRVPYRAE